MLASLSPHGSHGLSCSPTSVHQLPKSHWPTAQSPHLPPDCVQSRPKLCRLKVCESRCYQGDPRPWGQMKDTEGVWEGGRHARPATGCRQKQGHVRTQLPSQEQLVGWASLSYEDTEGQGGALAVSEGFLRTLQGVVSLGSL